MQSLFYEMVPVEIGFRLESNSYFISFSRVTKFIMKTHLATLISLNAIPTFGSKVRFYTVAVLVNKLIDANQTGTLTKVMKQIEKLDLLVLDELRYIPLNKEGTELLFQVISICYENNSIIITTNLQFAQWSHVFGDPILTEAVIDRLIHHSHLLLFTGDSFRYKESLQKR